MKIVSGMDANMTSIDGLYPDTVYNVQVSATTQGGDGNFSETIQVTLFLGGTVHACKY